MKRRSRLLKMLCEGLADQISAAETLKQVAAPSGQTLVGEYQNRQALELLLERHLHELRRVADLAGLAANVLPAGR